MERLQIRHGTESDVPDLVHLHKESLPSTYGRFLSAEAVEPWLEGGRSEAYMASRWRNMFVAEVGEEIVAFAVLEGAFLELLWVVNGWRGAGVGAALMDWLEARAASEHGVLELECYEPNQGALRFYRRRGYEVVGRRFNEGAGVADLLLRKELP